ncbi:MAG: Asp-tRNA(Asn)/Glu-tRNA(Gln) amidotransferase GatCAB subunit C [Proteobacteria bacterium]|jgi:aspartyl-tRNA(Asn)/glutamyl-tRNA(Gln) amidotransferase subunit C|nr:Asp-tRNA(Asn)/Glu-tRNA(Gln) amidotransferase GatCAB subunit C [Pseudomonadota bacterium]NBP14398.1 Asp-tRNA(Asn)/Glu-tRNA(Gln) amidotransferase GatCAB subunit C [bacterium]
MKITKEEVIKIAQISRIAIQQEEVESLTQQLQDVLSYAQVVKDVANQLLDQPSNRNINFLRDDVVVTTDSEIVLSRAPEREENYFVVPKILDNK